MRRGVAVDWVQSAVNEHRLHLECGHVKAVPRVIVLHTRARASAPEPPETQVGRLVDCAECPDPPMPTFDELRRRLGG